MCVPTLLLFSCIPLPMPMHLYGVAVPAGYDIASSDQFLYVLQRVCYFFFFLLILWFLNFDMICFLTVMVLFLIQSTILLNLFPPLQFWYDCFFNTSLEQTLFQFSLFRCKFVADPVATVFSCQFSFTVGLVISMRLKNVCSRVFFFSFFFLYIAVPILLGPPPADAFFSCRL